MAPVREARFQRAAAGLALNPGYQPAGKRPETPAKATPALAKGKSELIELESFINDFLAAPAEEVDSEVAALVRAAIRARPSFSGALALRALRLEQRLRQTQQQVIQLQWDLARLRQHEKTLAPKTDGVED